MAEETKRGPENPKAKAENLLTEEVAGELLIYDVNSNRAHCLNETAAAIWQNCNGRRSINTLAKQLFPKLEASDGQQLVALGVERLRRRRLLESSGDAAPAVDLSRRDLLKKVAILTAAAGVAAPLVSSVIAPNAAYAFSCMPSGFPCGISTQCCPGLECILMHCSD
jgi:hypothetical protein